MKTEDTIAAIATANGPGGIGIVRLSGDSAIILAKQVFRPKNRSIWSRLLPYQMGYGTIRSAVSAGNERIDEAICLVFRSPKSYTGEDVVELQCHGGLLVLQQTLDACLAAGARLAEPGEFTRRAYLNGRLDLPQAEAVMQLVAAQNEQALRAARGAMGGALQRKIAAMRESIIAQAAHINAALDYPDEDISPVLAAQLAAALRQTREELSQLLAHSDAVRPLITGVNTALLGMPNVGKSSLLNRLIGYERAIVTDIPGTTRDTLTETVALGKLTLHLTDTAGIRASADPIEQAGVTRSRAALSQADLLLLVTDGTQALGAQDLALLHECDPARTLLLRNKCDLGRCEAHNADGYTSVAVSAVTGEGLAGLADAIEALLQTAQLAPGEALLANTRQIECARQAKALLEDALFALQDVTALDAVAFCLQEAVQALLQLTGARANEAITDAVFAQFCVGK